jgi:competence protein ComEA
MKFIGILTLLTAFALFADDKATAKKAATAKVAEKAAAAAPAPAKVLDLNSAKVEELEALPVIGKAKAAKIVAGRPFKGKDELVSKKILTDAEYAKVKDLVIAKQK